MYYHLRITTSVEYPCSDYFDKQIVVKELQDTNPHYHAIVFTDKTQDTVRKYIRRQIPELNAKGLSFVPVKKPQNLHKYIMKEGNVIINTIPEEDLLLFFQSHKPKVTKKKGETFMEFIALTYSGDGSDLDIQKHVFDCFVEKNMEISKKRFQIIYQTMRLRFKNNLTDGERHKFIPSSWLQYED